jgi:uncharacterized damage-inducible protein DinB
MKELLLIACLSFCTTVLFAQSADDLKKQYLADWKRAKAYTQEYLDAMPAAQYSFRTHDSVRTFAQQMLHLAQGNIGLVANGTGAERIWQGQNLEQRSTAQSADSVRILVVASYDYAINAISNMNATVLAENFKRGNFEMPRFAWLNKAFEHQTHHRGQTTMYIRALGLKPPPEKLF